MTTPEHGIRPERLKYLVFAGNFKEYRQWALTSGAVNGAALYVANPENLNHVDPNKVECIIIGTFHLRPDCRQIMEMAAEKGLPAPRNEAITS